MREILREILCRKKIPWTQATKLRLALDVELNADGECNSNDARRFADDLLGRVQLLVQEATVGDQPFPPGQVRCFWCGSFECSHARPPEPRAVFKGYSPTGQPLWLELGALALQEQHPAIGGFYDDNPRPITLLHTGSALTRDQLTVYGKHSDLYRVLGQLVVGYIPPPRGNPRPSRQAVTIQVVESCVSRPRYHLNVIGVFADGRPVEPFLEEFTDSRFADALHSARGKLADLSLMWQDRSGAKNGRFGKRSRRRPRFHVRERWAMKVLRGLARNLSRIYRQSNRRTYHAQTRNRDRERPTTTALRDALRANPASIFRDVQEKTWVVVGPRSRVHVFNDAGRHITSVSYSGETVKKRTTQGKWRNGNPAALESFRRKLLSLASPPS